MENTSKPSYISFKILIPHIIVFGIITVLMSALWGNMMLTGNNGEFGYPEEGIYVWENILPVLGVWFAIFFCIFELPLVCCQFCYQYVTHKADSAK